MVCRLRLTRQSWLAEVHKQTPPSPDLSWRFAPPIRKFSVPFLGPGFVAERETLESKTKERCWSRSLSSGVPPSCKVGDGSWRHPAHSPPHLRYCILSTLTPPISVLLFIKTGPLKFWIWILSMICLSRGSLKVPVTLMLYGTPCLLWW